MNNKRLSRKQRERLFCRYYLISLDAQQAAKQAGLPRPGETGPLLLTDVGIQEYLKELEDENKHLLMAQAIEGYRRLAFSSAQDAIHLLDREFDPKNAENLDLFSVSEIKTSPSGVQIKFFDRQKALDKLYDLAEAREENSTAPPLVDSLCDAIAKGAQALSELRESQHDG
ncbi:MAG TPA: terminase small subunit [Firmicutes bacterium]|nr:terminase small subunit [Bacillota bacterium]